MNCTLPTGARPECCAVRVIVPLSAAFGLVLRSSPTDGRPAYRCRYHPVLKSRRRYDPKRSGHRKSKARDASELLFGGKVSGMMLPLRWAGAQHSQSLVGADMRDGDRPSMLFRLAE
jgi:hypothetical protein